MFPYRKLVLFSLLVCSLKANAQDEDFGIWAAVGYDMEIVNDLDLSIEQEFRLEDNARRFGSTFTDVGLEYELIDAVRIGGTYRFVLNQLDNGLFGHRHRTTTDLKLRHEDGRWQFEYRARMQWEVRGWNYTNETGRVPSSEFRNKFSIEYRLNRRVAPFVDFNVRYQNFDPNNPGFSGINRYRYRGGVEFLLAENRTFTLFFLHDRDVNVTDPLREYVIGIEFGFEGRKPIIGS